MVLEIHLDIHALLDRELLAGFLYDVKRRGRADPQFCP